MPNDTILVLWSCQLKYFSFSMKLISQQHLSLQKESKLLNDILVSFYLENFIIKFVIFTDESEDESEEGEDTFMHSYSDALNEELKATTLKKSFVRADEQAPKKDEVLFFFFCKWG